MGAAVIDVFFCTVADPKSLRGHMTRLCWRRWKMEQQGHLYWLAEKEGDPRSFQRQRRIIADERATTPIYVCADDDCLPGYEEFVERAVEIMERHPQFGILSMWPVNCQINRWTPEGYGPFEDEDVMEHVSVGGIRFCRQAVVDWPDSAPAERGYDRQHADVLRAAGYRVGYFKHIQMNHIGEGYSMVWR